MAKDIDPGLFRETLGHYPTGVAVVTAIAPDGNPVGMVVGTFSSVSMDPPLIAFYPMSNSRSFAALRTATAFCINVSPPTRRRSAAGSPRPGRTNSTASSGAPPHSDRPSWTARSRGSSAPSKTFGRQATTSSSSGGCRTSRSSDRRSLSCSSRAVMADSPQDPSSRRPIPNSSRPPSSPSRCARMSSCSRRNSG